MIQPTIPPDTTAQHLHWIGSVPLGSTIATFGLLGNIISIIVWRRLIKDKLKNNQSTGIYLIVLAMCDAGMCKAFIVEGGGIISKISISINIYDIPKISISLSFSSSFWPNSHFFSKHFPATSICVLFSKPCLLHPPLQLRSGE